MIIFAIIAGILLIILALLLCLPALAGLEYMYSDGRQKLTLHVRCLGIPIRIPIPTGEDDAEGQRKKKRGKPKKESAKSTEKANPFSRFSAIANGIRKAYAEAKDDIASALAEIRKKTEFETIVFRLGFGLSDAAKTGIATGAAWASASCILSVLNQMFGIRSIDLDVSPDFNRECFRLHIKSILRLRPVHIISISIKIIKIVNLFIKKMDIE